MKALSRVEALQMAAEAAQGRADSIRRDTERIFSLAVLCPSQSWKVMSLEP